MKHPSRSTIKQVEVWKLVHARGLTQEKAGIKLGISQQAVQRRLSRLQKVRPAIFPVPLKNRRKSLLLTT